MKTSRAIQTVLLANIVLVASSQAAGVQTRSEGDILFGQGSVTASVSEPYTVTGPVQQRSENYLLWNLNSQASAEQPMGPVRIADDRRMSTDLVYGS